MVEKRRKKYNNKKKEETNAKKQGCFLLHVFSSVQTRIIQVRRTRVTLHPQMRDR